MKKEIGYIGLGKMGKNMIFRLLEKNWKVIAYNRDKEKIKEAVGKGAGAAMSLKELVSSLSTPRVVWVMVSHQAVDEMINELTSLLAKGDLIIDGGNSLYRDSIRRSKKLAKKGIGFLDIGVSGGPSGALSGACMMVGGEKNLYEELKDSGFFEDTCAPNGFAFMGKSGAGHFVKMVHNGIEYGMMQSIAEGFDLMRHSSEFDLDLEKVADVYSNGSVIVSRLISWMQNGYKKYGKDLNMVSGRASASGEGKWTLEAGKREGISMGAIGAALNAREDSQKNPSYQGKVISALRGEFGEHLVKKQDDEPEVL